MGSPEVEALARELAAGLADDEREAMLGNADAPKRVQVGVATCCALQQRGLVQPARVRRGAYRFAPLGRAVLRELEGGTDG